MSTTALYVTMHARPGKEGEVERFLHDALPTVQEETATTAWFALRIDPVTYGIFDVFSDETGRDAHLADALASALDERAGELLEEPPTVHTVDVLAQALPGPETGMRRGWDATEWRPRREDEERVPRGEPGWDATEWRPAGVGH